MATSFLASGVIGLVPALAVMLGAKVGTALVTCALAFDVTLVFPALIFAGLVTFRAGTRTRTRNLGRAAIGLGLDPPRAAPPRRDDRAWRRDAQARELVAAVTREPLPVLLLAALLT